MDNKSLEFKDYLKIALLFGLVYATLPIIFTEITWDSIADKIGMTGLLRELIGSFLRAALLEELFKFFAFRQADKRYKFKNEREFIWGAGVIGLTYGIVEKVVTGNPINIILGIIFPMHLLWQMNQGKHYFRYLKAKENKDKKKAKHELFMATLLIFIIHGCWDAVISVISYLLNESTKIKGSDLIGSILFVVLIAFGITYIVISIKKLRNALKNNPKTKKA